MSPALLLILALVIDVTAATDAGSAIAMQADLRAAAEARGQRATEDQRWKEERQRLRIVIEAQQRALREVHAEAGGLATERGLLQAELASATASTPVAAQLAAAAQRLEERLRTVADHAVPGLVEWPNERDPDEAFAALVAIVQQAELANGQFAVLSAEGELAGQRRMVRMLRAGGACAWWVTLDGTQAGIVQRRSGRVELVPDGDPGTRLAIVSAMRQIESRNSSGLVDLPLPSAEEDRP